MKKQSFILKELDLRKLPGLPQGLKKYEDFSPGINIIYGPNASGKSSTLRAVQQLIWQESRRGTELEARAEIGGDPWFFRIDHQPVLTQKNYADARLVGVPAREMKSHYALSIDDLFINDNRELAREIQKQAMGGYDLAEAHKKLKYSGSIAPVTIREYKAYDDARKEVRKIGREQVAVKDQERSLIQLREEEESARSAAVKVDYLQKRKDFLEKSREVAHLKMEKGRYPEVMASLRGDEAERIEALEEEIDQHRKRIGILESNIRDADEILTGLEIPVQGIPEEVLEELDVRIGKLQSLEQKISHQKTELAGLDKDRAVLLRSIDPGLDPTRWEGVDINDTGRLDEILSRTFQVLGKHHVLQSELDRLALERTDLPGNMATQDQMRKALSALSEWMKEPAGEDGMLAGMAWTVVGGMLILTGVLVFEPDLAEVIVFIMMGLAVVMAIVFWMRKGKSRNRRQNIREEDFASTQIDPPVEWTPESVAVRIGELAAEMEIMERQLQNEDRKRRILSALENHENELEELRIRMDAFSEVVGTAPEWPDFGKDHFLSFYWFVKKVEEWLHAHRQYLSLYSRSREDENQRNAELEKINAIFTNRCNAAEAGDAATASARLRRLKQETGIRYKTLTRKKHEGEDLRKTEEQLAQSREKRELIYNALRLPDQDKNRLQRYLDDLEAYKTVVKKCEEAEYGWRERRREVEGHVLHESEDASWGEEKTTEQLEIEIEKFRKKAEKHEDLLKQITGIETRIDQKMKGDELERALADMEETKAALGDKFVENLNLIAGDLITSYLQNESHEHHQPEVVKRANYLLGKITHYRYELLSTPGTDGAFYVKDGKTGTGQALEELSAGTRIQLLLAIKIAYLEMQESGLKLPLLADELLANSDDVRSPAMIEAFTELSREGRQIFYFTAQYDEMQAWEYYLSQKDVHYRVYHIGEKNESRFTRGFVPEVADVLGRAAEVPAPDGLNYEEYGELLDLDFHLMEDHYEQLPLYFLADDPAELYELLEKQILNWARLETYIRYGGHATWITSAELDKMREKVGLLGRFQALYRTGRSRQIGREEIEDSGAVSATHMENVMELLRKNGGHPELLIEGLRAGMVSRFHTQKIDELEEYLIDHDFLDRSPRMEEEEIRTAIEAQISQMKSCSREEAEEFLQRILDHQRKPGPEKAEEIF